VYEKRDASWILHDASVSEATTATHHDRVTDVAHPRDGDFTRPNVPGVY
jgi:hypothetical protein